MEKPNQDKQEVFEVEFVNLTDTLTNKTLDEAAAYLEDLKGAYGTEAKIVSVEVPLDAWNIKFANVLAIGHSHRLESDIEHSERLTKENEAYRAYLEERQGDLSRRLDVMLKNVETMRQELIRVQEELD